MKSIRASVNLPLAAGLVLLLGACDRPAPETPGSDAMGHTPPTAATTEVNRAVAEALDLANQQDFEDARRGMLAAAGERVIMAEGGAPVWDLGANAFIAGPSPDSVNPSLWRQAQLNNIAGLFEVVPGIYQVRGFDLSNMTLIEGQDGWIVVDPLTARETARAAIEFAFEHLPVRPVTAVIFTHSHVDHFGGVLGLLAATGVEASGLRIIAPEGFMHEATSENIIAGTAMSRRAMFMYGKRLERSPRGHLDSGLGISPAFGAFGLLQPTEIVDRTPQPLEIDGVEFVFQNAPGSEAPAELTFYLPAFRAFHGAEVTTHTLHNLYTLRGAKVRDAIRWSGYIDEAIGLFGEAEVFLASHHWPVWGAERVREYLEIQRDTYKYLHDQTVRMFNLGHTPGEIAEAIELPESLEGAFHNRGYYGTLKHNSRAIYQNYLGWYDGNPAHLDPHPPVEAARRYVDLAGGAEAVMNHAREAFDRADYRWVAELLNHLVFADPGHREARALLAASYDQLGYQAESGPWRDVYLAAAFELRHGPPEQGLDLSGMVDLLRQTPLPRFFESMATRLDGSAADGVQLSVDFVFTDLREAWRLEVNRSVLHHRPADPDAPADATLQLTHGMFLALVTGRAGVRDLLFSDEVELEGSEIALARFFSLFDPPDPRFDIVTP